MLRFLHCILDFIAALVCFAILLVLLVVWRLSASPISSNFLTPYIEAAIENLLPDSKVHAGGSLLTWDNVDRSIVIHVEDVAIATEQGRQIGTIPSIDARISLLGIVVGHFLPRELSIQQPDMSLERRPDGAFVFGGMAVGGGPADPSDQRPLKEVLHTLSDDLSHSIMLHKLSVTDAAFEVHDDVTNKNWKVSLPEVSLNRAFDNKDLHELDAGKLKGHILVEVTQKDVPATLDVTYVYDPVTHRHDLSTAVNGLTPAWLAGGHPETLGMGAAANLALPLTGKIDVRLDDSFNVVGAEAQMHGGEGDITYTDLWNGARHLKSLDLHAVYDLDSKKLTIDNTHADFDGPTLDLTVDGVASAKPGFDMDYTVNLQVDDLPVNRFDELWPNPVVPNARYWLAANLREGTFTHGEATLKGSFAWNDLDNLSIDTGEGKVAASGTRVTYLDGMPPVQNVAAEATFTLKDFSVHVLSGGIGNIRLSPFTVQVTGLADPDQYIDIPLQVGGPIPDVMQLLDHKPLGYAKKLGVAPEDISGAISGLVHFHFPLLKTLQMKDVDIHAQAQATDVASTKLVPGMEIDQGNVGLTLDMSGFALKGQANIDKIPFQVTWAQNFDAVTGKPLQQAVLNGVVHDNEWKQLGIDVFAGTKGPVNLTFEMDRLSKTTSHFTASLDMTQAAIAMELIDWHKTVGTNATLHMEADASDGKPINVKVIDLRGDGISGTGTASLSPDMTQLTQLDMPRLLAGRNDSSVHFAQSFGDNGTLSFSAEGKSLDIAGLRSKETDTGAKPETRAQHFSIKVDRLYTGAFGEIDMAQGSAARDAQGWSAIDLHGLVGGDSAGSGKVMGLELTPQPDGSRTFAINCDDFGECMKGLGFTDTVKGGKLTVAGRSAPDNPREIDGTADISAFSVTNLPVLALLINSTSPFGFAGIVTDSADFSRFEGDFKWQGVNLTLTKAHAAGSAMGINVDGTINLDNGAAKLQGTLVPFSTVNKILNYIPVIGDILTGGDNQGVLAVAYTIGGTLDKPEISVNPVSLLTPGFLRNLFFRDDTDSK